MERHEVRFVSGRDECAAWHYPGSNGGCVIMAGGLAVTRGPGTDRFARRFHKAGFSVLAFDYRRMGGSGGTPRQVARLHDDLADWHAAIGYAATRLPDVDPARLAVWAFSASGGHVFRVAARDQRCARRSPRARTPTVRRRPATRPATSDPRRCLPGGHYAPFLASHEEAVTAELSFLRRHLLSQPAPAR